MSLQAKINREIKAWEEKIAQKQLTVDRMKLKIRHLRELLDMAKVAESES